MINKIQFKNYKLFKNWQTLELKPITIIIGKNNSGKSAIVKLPTLISSSLSGEFKQPLKLKNNGISLGLSFEDLVYNRYTSNSLKLELHSEIEKLSIAIYSDRNNKLHIAKYEVNNERIIPNKTITKGFLHNGSLFETLKLKYDYIGPFRELPSTYYNETYDEFNNIGIKGENAYPILIQNNDTEFFKKVSDWYKANFEGWCLNISSISGLTQNFEIGLENKKLQTAVNLVNVGQGIHQVLPLIVRSYMPVDEKTLIIIEEPETHLHPAAHGNLSERFAKSYLEDKNKHYLIETHSQNFVLRMRRLVAEGRFNKDDLAIYYVKFDSDKCESVLEEIEVDSNGGLPNNDWPKGIFSETSIETRAIFNAQLNNLSDVD